LPVRRIDVDIPTPMCRHTLVPEDPERPHRPRIFSRRVPAVCQILGTIVHGLAAIDSALRCPFPPPDAASTPETPFSAGDPSGSHVTKSLGVSVTTIDENTGCTRVSNTFRTMRWSPGLNLGSLIG
jgi:hypothetical protein